MWVVICSIADSSALWAYQGLKELGVAPLELVLAEQMNQASRWQHRLDETGTHLKLTLQDGRTVCSSLLRGVINRLVTPAMDLVRLAHPSDAEYAQAELHAFYLSWLSGLPGSVFNRPSGSGLCGPWYHTSEWIWRAAKAGFSTAPYRCEPSAFDQASFPAASLRRAARSVVVLRDQVFGPAVPIEVADACVRLAKDVGTELLGVRFADSDGAGWTFVDATACPDLALGGAPLLEHLAQRLTSEETP